MSFELTNVPNTFMRLMKHILHNFLGRFVMVYFYDILIYSNNLDEHVKHLKNLLDVFLKNVYMLI